MTDYRWNLLDNARGYDAAADILHPYYRAIQDVLLEHLPLESDEAGVVVDLGGGSGRLAERILERHSRATVWIIDQSEPFLSLARQRLERFDERAFYIVERLQNPWSTQVTGSPDAIVSMSAIHHLDAAEKQRLYRQCAECLAPGGVLMNGDEVRPPREEDYLAHCRSWAQHMHRQMDSGRIPDQLQEALLGWEARNVRQFGTPRRSGDDCHETAATQLEYYRRADLHDTSVIWQKELWAVLFGKRPSN